MLRTVELTAESIDYIKQELDQGGYLSKQQRSLDFTFGHIFTYFPKEFIPPTPIDFGESLEFLTGKRVIEEFNSKISELIRTFLDREFQNVAIFETMWNESDPISIKSPLQYFSIKGRRYGFLSGGDDKNQVEDHMKDAQGYPTIITLVDGKEGGFGIRNKLQITEYQAKVLAKKTEFLIVGAYDGEGYLIWKKEKAEQR